MERFNFLRNYSTEYLQVILRTSEVPKVREWASVFLECGIDGVSLAEDFLTSFYSMNELANDNGLDFDDTVAIYSFFIGLEKQERDSPIPDGRDSIFLPGSDFKF